MTARVYLALGSNLGDRLALLQAAVDGLSPGVRIEGLSRIYETAPMYVTDQPPFLNMAVAGWTDLSPLELLDHAKRLEEDIGRIPSFANGPRAIDIDILSHGDTIMETPRLTLPHPRIAERAFVLAPLADLAPDSVLTNGADTVADHLRAVDGTDTIRVTAMRLTHG